MITLVDERETERLDFMANIRDGIARVETDRASKTPTERKERKNKKIA